MLLSMAAVANASEAAARKRSAVDVGRCLLGLQQLLAQEIEVRDRSDAVAV
jgi:hypothetical protein